MSVEVGLVNLSETPAFFQQKRPSRTHRGVRHTEATVWARVFSVAQTGISVAQTVGTNRVRRSPQRVSHSICKVAATHVF